MRDVKYAIVVGGAAAGTAAEAIRKRDPRGSVAIFTREWAPPYQRPPLSKDFLQGQSPLADTLMFPPAWYLENDVQLFAGVDVTGVDLREKTLATAAGPVRFERALLATGCLPRSLDINGSGLSGVFALRTYLDAVRLRGVRESAQRVVMIGSGFIGMEVAASLRSGGCEVTVVTVDPTLYARFGPELSAYAGSLFERHGVQTLLHTEIASIEGTTRVTGITLADGRSIQANAVIVGIGVTPDAALAKNAGLHVEDGIVVDAHLRTSSPDVYAAGDVACFPGLSGTPVRVEHFDHAYSSGSTAGANMAGADESYRYVPFFWSDVFELSFEFVGETTTESRIAQGNVESGSFVIEYTAAGRLRGALLAHRPADERDAYRARLGDGA